MNCYLRVEVRSERFIPHVGASRVDKNLKFDVWNLPKKKQKKKAPVDMWEVLNSRFLEEKSSIIINIS